jgi:uncharacterized hydrophobic protein (TIGR00271 family)
MRTRRYIEKLLGVTAGAKPGVYLHLYESAEFFGLNYIIELLLAAGIATLGLVLNSPAVVIGGMLVSPLMGPILATGLALAASDVYLGIKCFINIVLSFLASVLFSAILVWILPFHSPTTEILARTQPNLLDLGVALFSGLAGSLVVCRGGGGGGVTALPGVAIAVALMPPLCTLGFGVGSGWEWPIISGAALLFLTNLAAIVACAFLVFLLVHMDSKDIRESIAQTELEHASHDRLYALLQKTVLRHTFGNVGLLRWRVAMLVVTLTILFVPLRKSLIQVRDESISRTAVRDAVRSLGPPDALLSQQLDILPDRIFARLVVAAPISSEKVQAAEREVSARSGKPTTFSVRQVASQEEMDLLRERLAAPPPAPPPAPRDLESIRKDLVARIDAPLKEAWPSDAAPLLGYELGFTPEGMIVHVRYESRTAIDATVQEVLTRVLKARLKTDNLQVVMERQAPAPPPRARRSK